MSEQPASTDVSLLEQLVAYLDGELDAPASRKIEELLAADPDVRRRLQQLDHTWQLLGELDATPVDDRFAQSTLEMVAVAAAAEVEQCRAEAPRRRRRRGLLLAGGVAVAGLAGFLAAVLLLPDPNKRLLQELPVLENLDRYMQIGDFEFLPLLKKAQIPLFVEEHVGGQVAEADDSPAQQSLAQRRQRVEAMTSAEKEQTLRRQEKFESMDATARQNLVTLHDEIDRDPQSAQLRQIMLRYCDWLKGLPQYRREELADLEPQKRVERIKVLIAEQAKDFMRRPPTQKDAEGLRQWMKDYAAGHKTELLNGLSPDDRQSLDRMKPSERTAAVERLTWQPWRVARPSQISDSDLADLRSKLSAETRKRLEAMPPDEQWGIIIAWIQRELHPWGPRRGQGLSSPMDDQRLAEFFEHEISDDERDRLMNLPGDEMQQQLRMMYMRQYRPQGLLMQGPNGPGRGRRAGPSGPPGAERPFPPRRPESGEPTRDRGPGLDMPPPPGDAQP